MARIYLVFFCVFFAGILTILLSQDLKSTLSKFLSIARFLTEVFLHKEDHMKPLSENLEIQAQILESIIDPKISSRPDFRRVRSSPTKIKSLFHLYCLYQNIRSKKWTEIYQGITSIKNGAKVSQRHFSNFINNPDFLLFGSVKHREGQTSIYELHPWLIDIFDFFKKVGMMRNFRTDFHKWKEVFLKRFHKWFMPLVRKGKSLSEILKTTKVMNKFSTRKDLKGHGSETLKGHGIKSSSFRGSISSIKHSGSKSNTEQSDPLLNGFFEATDLLRNRFQLKEGDLRWVINYLSLKDIRSGIRMEEQWLKNGLKIRSPIETFMGAVKKAKSLRNRN